VGAVEVGRPFEHRIAGERSRIALWGSGALALALQLQAGLGWAPGALPTAIHVPLGVCIFAGATALRGTIGRSLTNPAPTRWQGGTEHTGTATRS